jgi:hypothetical protein
VKLAKEIDGAGATPLLLGRTIVSVKTGDEILDQGPGGKSFVHAIDAKIRRVDREHHAVLVHQDLLDWKDR